MRKTFLRTVVISGVLLMVVGMTVALRLVYRNISTASRPAPNNNIDSSTLTVLQAHGGRNDKEWTRFTQKGTLTYYPAMTASPQRVFERELRLSLDRSIVRYDKATLDRKQSF